MTTFINKKSIDFGDNRLIGLWERVLETCEEINSTEAKNIMYATADFVENIQLINDKVVHLFKRALDNFSSHPRIHRLAESIVDIIEKQPDLGSQLFETLLSKVVGDYSYGKEKIIVGLKKMYENQLSKRANSIAIHLAEQGNFYVMKVYNEFNPQKIS